MYIGYQQFLSILLERDWLICRQIGNQRRSCIYIIDFSNRAQLTLCFLCVELCCKI